MLVPLLISVRSISGSSRSGRSRLTGGICGSARRSIWVLAPRFIESSVGFPAEKGRDRGPGGCCCARAAPSIAAIIAAKMSVRKMRLLFMAFMFVVFYFIGSGHSSRLIDTSRFSPVRTGHPWAWLAASHCLLGATYDRFEKSLNSRTPVGPLLGNCPRLKPWGSPCKSWGVGSVGNNRCQVGRGEPYADVQATMALDLQVITYSGTAASLS